MKEKIINIESYTELAIFLESFNEKMTIKELLNFLDTVIKLEKRCGVFIDR